MASSNRCEHCGVEYDMPVGKWVHVSTHYKAEGTVLHFVDGLHHCETPR